MTPLISSTWQRQQKRIAMQFIEEKPPWSNNLCCWLTITIFSWTLTNDHCDIPNYLFLLTREYRAGQLRLPKNRACEGASDILTFWKHRDCFKFLLDLHNLRSYWKTDDVIGKKRLCLLWHREDFSGWDVRQSLPLCSRTPIGEVGRSWLPDLRWSCLGKFWTPVYELRLRLRLG